MRMNQLDGFWGDIGTSIGGALGQRINTAINPPPSPVPAPAPVYIAAPAPAPVALNPKAQPSGFNTNYLLIGGGVLAVLLVSIVLMKRGK